MFEGRKRLNGAPVTGQSAIFALHSGRPVILFITHIPLQPAVAGSDCNWLFIHEKPLLLAE